MNRWRSKSFNLTDKWPNAKTLSGSTLSLSLLGKASLILPAKKILFSNPETQSTSGHAFWRLFYMQMFYTSEKGTPDT